MSGEDLQPGLVLLANTGEQLFSSNQATAKSLLRMPLLPQPLAEGDVVEAFLDLNMKIAQFRVNRGDCYKVQRLPQPPKAPRGQATRFNETVFRPFWALRGGVEVELFEGDPARNCAEGIRAVNGTEGEALVLVGPRGAGKSTWAESYRRGRPPGTAPVHILGAELLLHRATFSDPERPLVPSSSSSAPAPVPAPAPEPVAAAPADDGDTDDEDLGEQLRLCLGGSGSSSTAPPPTQVKEEPLSLEEWSLSRARRSLRTVVPECLRRASQRRVGVVADDCHLQATERAALKGALKGYTGRVRWMTVLPATLEELERRLAASGQSSEERRGGSLPDDSEFAEGHDVRVFQLWLEASAAKAEPEETKDELLAPREEQSVEAFFEGYGEERQEFLSTEGCRRG